MQGNQTHIRRFTLSGPRKSQGHRNSVYTQKHGAHVRKSLRGGSIHTHRHTQIPTDTHAGTGVGREALILHKAGPLRGAPRHRGPLLTKPPLSSKSDPPSRLQRGQGTRLPCPPPSPGSAPLLGSKRGGSRPATARGVSPRLPQGRIASHPCSRASRASVGAQGPKILPVPARGTEHETVACAPSEVPGPVVPGLAGA